MQKLDSALRAAIDLRERYAIIDKFQDEVNRHEYNIRRKWREDKKRKPSPNLHRPCQQSQFVSQ